MNLWSITKITLFMTISAKYNTIDQHEQLQKATLENNTDDMHVISSYFDTNPQQHKVNLGQALIHAAKKYFWQNRKYIKKLIKADADTTIQDIETKDTVLHYAVKAFDFDTTKALFAKGADINARNHTNTSPVHIVFKNLTTGSSECEDFIKANAYHNSTRFLTKTPNLRAEALLFLSNPKIDLEAQDITHKSPLDYLKSCIYNLKNKKRNTIFPANEAEKEIQKIEHKVLQIINLQKKIQTKLMLYAKINIACDIDVCTQ